VANQLKKRKFMGEKKAKQKKKKGVVMRPGENSKAKPMGGASNEGGRGVRTIRRIGRRKHNEKGPQRRGNTLAKRDERCRKKANHTRATQLQKGEVWKKTFQGG